MITDKSLPSSKNLKRVFRVHYRGHSWLRSPYIWGTIYVFIPFKWLQMKQEGWKIVFSCKWSKRDDKLYFHWGKGLLTMKKNHKYFIFKAFQTVPRPKSSKVVGRPRTTSDDLGRLWTTSDDFGRLWTTLDDFGRAWPWGGTFGYCPCRGGGQGRCYAFHWLS